MAEESNGVNKPTIARDILQEVPVYKDAFQPAAQEFGQELIPAGENFAHVFVTISKAARLVAAPFDAGIDGVYKLGETIKSWAVSRFKDKPEKLIAPLLNVAGPVIEAIRYSVDEPSLRDMYLKLLETSMDSDTTRTAHPAYVEIIKQLAPDEARILEELKRRDDFLVYNLSAQFEGELRRDYRIILEAAAILTPASSYKHFRMIPTFLDNLSRLQLTASRDSNIKKHLRDSYPGSYPELQRILSESKNSASFNWHKIVDNVVQHEACVVYGLTDFGRQFCEACVSTAN